MKFCSTVKNLVPSEIRLKLPSMPYCQSIFDNTITSVTRNNKLLESLKVQWLHGQVYNLLVQNFFRILCIKNYQNHSTFV